MGFFSRENEGFWSTVQWGPGIPGVFTTRGVRGGWIPGPGDESGDFVLDLGRGATGTEFVAGGVFLQGVCGGVGGVGVLDRMVGVGGTVTSRVGRVLMRGLEVPRGVLACSSRLFNSRVNLSSVSSVRVITNVSALFNVSVANTSHRRFRSVETLARCMRDGRNWCN